MKDFLTLQEFNKQNRQSRINFLILTLVRLYNGKYKFIELTLFYLQILQTKRGCVKFLIQRQVGTYSCICPFVTS